MPRELTTGEILAGRYVVGSLHFLGGEATVYTGTDTTTNVAIAIKQLAAQPGDPIYDTQRNRFRRCGAIRCNSPYVVDAVECVEEGNDVYLILPFIEGSSLQTVLDRNGSRPLPPPEAVDVTMKIAMGLDIVHRQGIVHRDIKPANVMITPQGQICLIDLTICRIPCENTLTGGNAQLGSISFMAPEQAKDPRSVDVRADLYSLGVVFYLLLTSRPPIQGRDEAEFHWNLETTIPSAPRDLNPAVPESVSRICMKLLAKRPEQRYQTALELVNELQSIGAASVVSQTASAVQARCPQCSRFVSSTQSFCGHCGRSLHQAGQAAVACVACGMPIANDPVCPQCQRPFSRSDHRLIFAEQMYRVPEGIFVVGRGELLSWDTGVSRQHLLVSCTNGTVHLQDAGSVNKTFVNGRLADQIIQLRCGDEVIVAGHIATYTHD